MGADHLSNIKKGKEKSISYSFHLEKNQIFLFFLFNKKFIIIHEKVEKQTI